MPAIQNLCYNCFHDNPNIAGACPYCGYDNIENRQKYPIALKAGSILNGQYIVGRVLGQGGFGITYLALDHRLNIKVAIKEYIPDGMATRLPETTLVSVYAGEKQDNFYYGSERFLDEARILARFIGNKNITAVKCFFDENNTVYFVMDYIEGISFKNYIKNRGGRVDYADALRVLLPVMDALTIVHREGLIHRDVTPDNIYITKDDEIKLLDFGSARYSLGDKSKSLDVILKSGYAPKEQYIKRGKQGPYTDVYSLSACFYASITGFLPPESLERMEEDEIVPISAHGIRIPNNLEAAIMKGLAVRAEDRWQSIDEFRAAMLSEVAFDEPQIVTEASIVTVSISPTVTSISPVMTGVSTLEVPEVVINEPPNLIYTRTELNSEANQHISAEPMTRHKEKRGFIKNRVAAVISAAACILLIISLIVLINNRSGYSSTSGNNSITASNSEKSTEASLSAMETLSDREETVTDNTEVNKAAEDKAIADKAAADKATADKAAADKAAADKAAADKAAADKAAECPYCDGTGKVECTWCDGTGISKENHQDDSGGYIYEGNPCPKDLECDWCDGTGKR